MFPARKVLEKTLAFLAISAIALATLAVREDCGINRLATLRSIPLPWFFTCSISESHAKLQWASSTLTLTITSTVNSLRIFTIYSKSIYIKCVHLYKTIFILATFIFSFPYTKHFLIQSFCKPTVRLQGILSEYTICIQSYFLMLFPILSIQSRNALFSTSLSFLLVYYYIHINSMTSNNATAIKSD